MRIWLMLRLIEIKKGTNYLNWMSDSMVFLKLQGYKSYKLTARKKENFLYSIESSITSAFKSLLIGRVLFQTKLNNNKIGMDVN